MVAKALVEDLPTLDAEWEVFLREWRAGAK
jgi:hypothetical protein